MGPRIALIIHHGIVLCLSAVPSIYFEMSMGSSPVVATAGPPRTSLAVARARVSQWSLALLSSLTSPPRARLLAVAPRGTHVPGRSARPRAHLRGPVGRQPRPSSVPLRSDSRGRPPHGRAQIAGRWPRRPRGEAPCDATCLSPHTFDVLVARAPSAAGARHAMRLASHEIQFSDTTVTRLNSVPFVPSSRGIMLRRRVPSTGAATLPSRPSARMAR